MKHTGKLFLLIGFYILVATVSLEMSVRWLVSMSDHFFMPDPNVGVRHIQNATGRWVSKEFDVPVQINSHGFRDLEREEQTPEGMWRVVVLGDSMTEAFQVSLDRTFVSVLEGSLSDRGHLVEVLNLGVSSLGTAQEYLLFKHYGVRYSPDVVVLAFYTGNDFRNNSRRLENDLHLRYPVVADGGHFERDAAGEIEFTPTAYASPVREFVRRNFQSYRFISIRVREIRPLWQTLYYLGAVSASNALDTGQSYGIYRREPSPVWREAVGITHKMIEELNAKVRRNGGTLFVAVIPAPWEVDARWRAERTPMSGEEWDMERPERLLRDYLHSHQIPALALSKTFREQVGSGTKLYFQQDGHLNEEGHRLVGEQLAEKLVEYNLVPGPARGGS